MMRSGIACIAAVVSTLTGCHLHRPRADVQPATLRVEVLAPSLPGPMRAGTPLPATRLRMPPSVASALAARPNLRPRLTRGGPAVRLVVSIAGRTLWLVAGSDTVFRTPVAVATGLTLVYGSRAWRFQTPRGERRVLRKAANPVWTPPEWHYAEAALDHRLRLAPLSAGGTTLTRGRRLVIRNGVVGIIHPGDHFRELPTNEHIVFDGKLFIPPIGTLNRRVSGELGRFALDLGQGYMIHGSSDEKNIDQATTHGCIRVGEDDLLWLYENVPIGTQVTIG